MTHTGLSSYRDSRAWATPSMGVERKTDNNNVITTSCGTMRTQFATTTTQSSASPPVRLRRSKMAPVTVGEDRVSVKSSAAFRMPVATRRGEPDGGIEVEKAERRISAGGFNRHRLLSGDTRLLKDRSAPASAPASTPVRRVSREKPVSSAGTQPPPPSGKPLLQRRATTDITKSASGSLQNKTPTKSGVPVRKANSLAEKRRSLPPGGGRLSEAASPAFRPPGTQRRLRPKSLGSETLTATATGHVGREAGGAETSSTPSVARGAPKPSATLTTSLSTRLSERRTTAGRGSSAAKITAVSISTSVSASVESPQDENLLTAAGDHAAGG